MTRPHVIRGRVRRVEGDGVLGLTVHAIDSDHQFDDDLGRTRTTEDGTFDLAFDPELLGDEPHEGELEIYLRVLDRDGNVLYVDDEARSLPVDDAEIALDDDALASHLSRPLAWEVPSGPVVPEEWDNVIDRAIDQVLADRGTEMHAQLLSTSRCPSPPILGEEGIIDTAMGAARGDPVPTKRFRRALDAAVTDRGVTPGEDYFSESWRRRVGGRMAERATAFEHLAEQDSSLTAGPISTEIPLRDCAGFSPDGDSTGLLDSDVVADVLDEPGEGLAERLGAATDELREYPSAVDPQVGRTLLAGAMNAAPDAERRRHYVAALFDALGSLAAYRDTYVVADRVLRGEAGAMELRAMISRGSADCGPADGPGVPSIPERDFPWDDLPIDIPGWEDEDDLVNEHWWAFCQSIPGGGVIDADPYTITRLSPATPCSGEQLTIHGRNFGHAPGEVVFESGDGDVVVSPDSWSDTEVTVTVPPDATAGEIGLVITRGAVSVCDKYFVKRAPPTKESITTWNGAKPSVSIHSPDELTENCFAPGETVDIDWSYRPKSLSDVTISMEDVDSKTVSTASGTWSVTVPSDISERTELTMRIEASNECGESVDENSITVDVEPSLSIDDVEVTQGIQSFTVGSGGPDNGLNTIEGKDTIVRVYVSADRNGFNDDEVPDVTGSLRVVGEQTLQPINGSSPTGGPAANPSITAVANPSRAETDDSLNFRIPAALASGQQTFDIYVQGPEICGSRASTTTDVTWNWTGNDALPVRYVRVRDNRSGTSPTRPSRDDAAFTVRRAFDFLPSPPTDIAPAPDDTMGTSVNFGGTNGVGNLLDELERHRLSAIAAEWRRRRDGLDLDLELLRELLSHHYVGLTQPFNRGIASNPGRVAISCIYQNTNGSGIDSNPGGGELRRVKTAHELGHNLGLDHVNQGCNGSSPDCNGSCYNHPTSGRLTETAFDPHWNRTLRDEPDAPGTEWDFMSYGCTRWASSDSWSRMQNLI